MSEAHDPTLRMSVIGTERTLRSLIAMYATDPLRPSSVTLRAAIFPKPNPESFALDAVRVAAIALPLQSDHENEQQQDRASDR